MNTISTNKHIAFTGPYADVNFGDYAMLVNNIYDFDIKNITVFSYDNIFLQKIKNNYLNEYNVDIIDVKLNDISLLNLHKTNSITPIDILFNINNYEELEEYIKSIDVLIVNGGGYFNSLWSMEHRIIRLVKIIAPILIASMNNKQIIFTGNSYGPFKGDDSFFSSFFKVLNNYTFHSRDNLFSPLWLKKIGISEDISIIPDDLYILNNKLLKIDNRKEIPLNKYILMETYLGLDFIKENMKFFKKFAIDIGDKYGLSIVFVPFNLGTGGYDQALFLDNEISNFSFIDIKSDGYLPIETINDLIKNAELVICSRYHSMVLSIANKTPVISVLKKVLEDHLYYLNKNLGLLNLVFKDVTFDYRDFIRLNYLEALEFIVNDYNKIVETQKMYYNNPYYLENNNDLKNRREMLIKKISSINND